MKIKKMMSGKVATIRKSATVKDAVKKMAEKGYGGLVVVQKSYPIGIFTKSDLLRVLCSGLDIKKTLVEEVMHTPVMPVQENIGFLTAARQMRKMDLRRFIVINKEEKLSGILTDLDVVKSYALNTLNYKLTIASVIGEGTTSTPTTPLAKIARTMVDEQCSAVVILKNRKPVGIINEALFVKLAARFNDPLKYKAEDKMIKRFCGAAEENSLRESVLVMIKNDFRNIIVNSDSGKFVGVVSLRELVKHIVEQKL